MSWPQWCIVYVLAINGLSHFYPQLKTGKLRRSKYLRIYSICHNGLIAAGIPVVLHDLLVVNSALRSRLNSNQIKVANIFFGSFNVALILACIHCGQLLQDSIWRMFERLRKLNHFDCRPAASPLRLLFLVKLLLISLQLVLQLYYLISNWHAASAFQCLGSFWKFCTSNMISAASLLIFALLWQLTNCQLAVQLQLEQLLNQQPRHPQQLLQLQHQQQLLLNIVSNFCSTFRHFLLWYLLRLVLTAIQSGYLLIRIQFGKRNSYLNFRTALLISVVTLHALMEFYLLNFLAGFIEQLRLNILLILQRAKPQMQLIERIVSMIPIK